MSINLSACQLGSRPYHSVFTNTANQPYDFVEWCYRLTLKALARAKDSEEAAIHRKNAEYLHTYVTMGA